MPSTYDPLLRLELQATGENATTWGVKTNTNLDLLAESIAGAVTLNVAGSGDYTLSTANGAEDEARQAILVLTGLLTGNRNIIVPSSPKNYTVINNTTGAFTVTLKQSAGTGLVLGASGSTITVCTSTTCIDATGATPYTRNFLIATSVAPAVSALGLANTATLVATSIGSALITAVDTSAGRAAIAAAGSGAVTASGLTMATSRLLGRTTSATGTVEEITVGSGLSLSAGSLSAIAGTGNLLNVQVFTGSGTYTRTSGATRAVVVAVGGGGGGRSVGSGGNGGTTSFGSHVSAAGGSGATSGEGGAGGTGGSGATIAIRGAPGVASAASFGGNVGVAAAGAGGGQGGGLSTTAGVRGGGGGGVAVAQFSSCCGSLGGVAGGGGGQGETCIRYITSGLGSTETVTIGAGGAGGTGIPGVAPAAGAGGAGYVIVYEYS